MDCYIIRVYRHIAGENGEAEEIAGLVERVGKTGNGRPFTNYKSLVNVLRDEVSGEADAVSGEAVTIPALQLVHTLK
jgi:hypothetical protein